MNHHAIDFVTLGMFILDDIHPPVSAEDQTPSLNVVGGAGTYSAIGARLLSPPPFARSVGWIVDAGTDFPSHVRDQLASWDTTLVLRKRDALTTRGWNGYGANEHRAFKYLTPKLRLTADDLDSALLFSRSFHLICSAERCCEIVQRILDRRRQQCGDSPSPSPLIIWEPVPDLCIASEKENILNALAHVDVLSPNHEEMASIFGSNLDSNVNQAMVETQAAELLKYLPGTSSPGAVVVRCGKEGCYVASRQCTRWLPAYHMDSGKVIDPTGGGNGFLGGLAIGLVRSNFDVLEGALFGTVAASLCIEQVGVPVLTTPLDDQDEQWNGTVPHARLQELRLRVNDKETT